MTETAPGGPVQSTAQIEARMLEALRDIRTHWAVLLDTGGSSSIAGKPQPKALYTRADDDEKDDDLPTVDRRVALSYEVTATLNSWARVIVEDMALTHHLPLGTDVLGLVEFLTRWARWFSGHEAAPDCTGELGAVASQMRAVVAPQRREWLSIGTCPLEVEVDGACRCHPRDDDSGHCLPKRVIEVCGGQVRAHPKRDPKCARCGTEAVASWWERVMFPDVELSELVTADELVVVLHRAFGGSPVKPSTIRQWIKRGVIVSSGKDDKGRTLYDRGAVVYAVARRAESS